MCWIPLWANKHLDNSFR